MTTDKLKELAGASLVILIFLFIIARGIYVIREAHAYSCPSNQTVVLDLFAVPLVQDAVSCE